MEVVLFMMYFVLKARFYHLTPQFGSDNPKWVTCGLVSLAVVKFNMSFV
jgi:hypothetical protein